MIKKISLAFTSVVLAFGFYYLYSVVLNYNFKTITDGKVYKSGVIPPQKIEDYVKKYNIKTIIDLRHGGLHDKDNPGTYSEIGQEKEAVSKIDGVKWVHIASGQVPNKETLTKFLKTLDDNSSYPVLIHCYHGAGRAVIYSAIYKIEYEGFNDEEARSLTRPVLWNSTFDKGTQKGDFLINYKPRRDGDKATINLLK